MTIPAYCDRRLCCSAETEVQLTTQDQERAA